MKKTLLFALFLSAAPFAHAGVFSVSGSDLECPKMRSLAWCLMDVHQVSEGLRDVPRNELPTALYQPGNTELTINSVVDVLGRVAGAAQLATGAGIGGAAGGGALLLMALIGDGNYPGRSAGGFAFIPEGQILEAVAMRDRLAELYVSAAITAMGALEAAESSAYNKDLKYTRRLKGGACEVIDCKVTSLIFGSKSLSLKEVIPPPYLGINDKVFKIDLGNYNNAFTRFGISLGCGNARCPASMYEKLSAALPGWLFIYMPSMKDLPVPVIFNRGNAIFFIAPGAEVR